MNVLLFPVYLLQSGLESGLESSLESGLESELESGLESDVDSDLESDVESGLVYETSSKVINHQLEKLKEASKELQTEVEVLLRDKKEFKNHLQQQVKASQICHFPMILTKRKKLSLHHRTLTTIS